MIVPEQNKFEHQCMTRKYSGKYENSTNNCENCTGQKTKICLWQNIVDYNAAWNNTKKCCKIENNIITLPM